MKKDLLAIILLLTTLLGSVIAQTRTITGTVTSAQDGESLPGVNVVVVDSAIGTITGINGEYSIEVPAGAQSLQFSYVGFEIQIISIGNRTVIDVVLIVSAIALNEVVVTAMGIEREKKALGFAAQELEEEELSAARELSVTRYLTGKVAGVQVTNTAAGTGGSSNVTIRGNSSLAGTNQPLYVVDGVPIINMPKDDSGGGGIWGGNDYGDGIGDINPEDIESVNVLKGPNASALYGSRGANGVIVITTKSASNRKGATVELNSNFSIERISLYPKLQNKYATGYEETNLYGNLVEIPPGSGQFYETMEDWHSWDSWGPPLDGRRTVVNPWTWSDNEEPTTWVLTAQPKDNTKQFYQTGFVNANTLAISGGDAQTSGRLSFGNVYQKGIIGDHKVTKYNLSLSGNSQVNKWLRFDGRFNYIRTDGSQRPNLGYLWSNINLQLITLGRYVPLDFLKEYYEKAGEGGQWPGVYENPFFILSEYKNNDYRDRMIANASATAQFTDWLSLLARVGFDLHTEHHKKTFPVGSMAYGCSRGRILTGMLHYRDLNADLMLTANKQLSENFHGSLTVGASLLTQRRDTEHMDARNLKAVGVYNISNSQEFYPSSYLWQKEMQSVYFLGQIAYKNWLFLDVTGRNDWSSALGKDEYSFFYPSVGLSWVFSDALNITGNVLSFGKARVSWAQVGNDSDPYLTKAGYTSYTTNFLGQGFASKSGTLPLFNLKNELTESWEIGGDLRFLQNRIGIDVTYYNGYTFNQILHIPVSVTSGYSTVVINAGKISNKGIEAILNLTPLSFSNGFRWDIAFNYARNKNMVEELAPGIDRYTLVPPDDNYPNSVYANPGEPYGNIYGYATKRTPAGSGYDGRYIINSSGAYQREASESVLGNITPDWIGGLNNTFLFKGFALNILIDFVQGGDLTSFTYFRQMGSGTGEFTEVGRRPQDTDDEGNQLPYIGVLDGVVEIVDAEGKVTGYEENTKAVDGQTYWAHRAWGYLGDWFVFDGSYICFREVMLSYRFRPSMLEKTPFYGITLSLVGRNLMYLENHLAEYGISPEAPPNTDGGYQGVEAIAIPNTRTIGMNVKLTF
jgi:TonB-linked SusC/RagA family outer membrane protein